MTLTAEAAQTRQDRATPLRPTRTNDGRRGLWFTVPFLVFFVAFLVVPIIYGLWMSVTNASLTGGGAEFAGGANYAEAFTDPEVWRTLRNTVFFTVISSIPLVLVALLLALLVYVGLPGQWMWRLSFFAPYLLPVAVVTAIWSWSFQPDLGFINGFLASVGIDQILFLNNEEIAMWSIALVTLWWTVGFNFLLYLAALQAIPEHLYEAAQLDGAGVGRRLWSVTLPMLTRTTGLIVVLQVLASLKVFDQIYLLTNGGPNGSTRSILEYIYDTGFTGYRLGYASAISYIFFAIILIVAIANLRLTARKES